MIKFSTGNGTYLSIPGNTPEDLTLAGELISMSIQNEQRILTAHMQKLCDVLGAVAALGGGGDG